MLTPLHKHVLLSGFLDIQNRLEEMECLLAQGGGSFPLRGYVNDLSPTEVKAMQDHFARIRGALLTCLEKHGVPPDVRRTSLRWALQARMTGLDIAVAEMGPERLRGYGSLDDAACREIVDMQQNIYQLLDRANACLSGRR
jgi:hypothetical protein